MSDYQITCATKDGSDLDRSIDAVGGPILGVHQLRTVIAMIKNGHTFWTLVNGQRANVRIGGTVVTGEFLTTSPDGYQPNNLLKLPNCQ